VKLKQFLSFLRIIYISLQCFLVLLFRNISTNIFRGSSLQILYFILHFFYFASCVPNAPRLNNSKFRCKGVFFFFSTHLNMFIVIFSYYYLRYFYRYFPNFLSLQPSIFLFPFFFFTSCDSLEIIILLTFILFYILHFCSFLVLCLPDISRNVHSFSLFFLFNPLFLLPYHQSFSVLSRYFLYSRIVVIFHCLCSSFRIRSSSFFFFFSALFSPLEILFYSQLPHPLTPFSALLDNK
jgi:hypothetical protein